MKTPLSRAIPTFLILGVWKGLAVGLALAAALSAEVTITSPSPLPAGTINQPYSFTFQATGSAPFFWEIVDGNVPNLTLSSDGTLSGTPQTAGVFQITVSVGDSSESGTSKDFIVPINASALAITSGAQLPGATVGLPYTFTFSASGGAGGYQWSTVNSTPPAGLTLGTNGVLNGSATTPGRANFSVKVQDLFNSTVTAPFTALVMACPASTAVAGQQYSSSVNAGPLLPNSSFTVSNGTLPTGLTLNSSTGAITGSPTGIGAYPVIFSVQDSPSYGPSLATCSITVSPAPLTLACPASQATVRSAYASTLVATGGVPTYLFSIATGILPQGLSLSPGSGAIAGTPTQPGTFPLTFAVKDTQNVTTSRSCTIDVAPAPPVLSCPAGSAAFNRPYSSSVGVSGIPPYSNFSVTGPLPYGLSLNPSTGTLIGTPQQSGSFQVTFSARDTTGLTGSRACTIQVAPPPLALACPAVDGTVNVSYASGIAANGGTSPYQYSMAGGTIPPGLDFNPVTGLITGSPTSAGSYAADFRVTDSTHGSVVTTCPFRIQTPGPGFRVLGTCTAVPYAFGAGVRINLTAAGGDGGYVFKLVSPDWMRLEESLGQFSAAGVAPSPGQYTLSATATDETGRQASFSCPIRVAELLEIKGSCPAATLQAGNTLSIPLAATGGQQPYNWKLDGPSWLRLAATNGAANEIFGTPPVTGNFDLSATVTDSINSKPPTFACTIRVPTGGTQITATPGCPAGKVPALQGYQQNFTANGQNAQNFVWTLTGPPWMTLGTSAGPATSISGTIPAEGGTFAYTITVRDPASNQQTSFSCQFDTLPALRVTASMPPLVQGQSFSTNLEVVGGQGPFTWKINGPGWITLGSSTTGPLTTLSGVPPNTDAFSCIVTVTDSAGSAPATFNCGGTVRQPALKLEQTGACPAEPIILGQNFSATLRATGGDGNYRWTVTGPGWLKPSATTGPSITISGVPDLVGNFDYSAQVSDGANTSETLRCTLVVNPPTIPTIGIIGLNLGGDVLQEITAGVQLAGPAPVRVEANVELIFEPSAFGATDNPQVQFLETGATNGGRQFKFIIEAGQTTSSLARIRPGTMSGALRLRVISLVVGGRDVLGASRPSRETSVPKLRPFITDVQFTNESDTGFTMVITGFSTPRDMITGTVTFLPRAGATLTGTTTFTVQLADVFRSYYSTAASQIAGSTFMLRLPATITGNKADIGGVTIKLSNSAGDSDPFTKSR
ncbi:MAG: putative Ig domain-containing protein [Bryobacterales bacterium]|nr:putative Ig domain-containing protein [Bryobacterales bacterium]